MKAWLSNRKNLPVIISILVLILLLAGAGGLYMMGVIPGFGKSATVADDTTTTVSAPVQAVQPPPRAVTVPVARGPVTTVKIASAGPTRPGIPAAKAAHIAAVKAAAKAAAAAKKPAVGKAPAVVAGSSGKTVVVVTKTTTGPTGVANPFAPKYAIVALLPPVVPVSEFVAFHRYASLLTPGARGNGGGAQPITAARPTGRLAGVVFSGGVHAIYESNGNTTVLEPGDAMPDGSGRVDSIQAAGITVRLSNDQTVVLPVTAGNS